MGEALSGTDSLLGLTQKQLDKFLHNYEQGIEKFFFRGKDEFIFGITEINIFDVSKLPIEVTRDEIEDSFIQEEQNHPYDILGTKIIVIFKKFGRDITDDYIHGPWGYKKGNPKLDSSPSDTLTKNLLKSPHGQNRFHIYIKPSDSSRNAIYRLLVPESEVIRLGKAHSQAIKSVIINGEETEIKDSNPIKIFRVPDSMADLTNEEIRLSMRRASRKTLSKLINLAVLRKYGEEVTAQYITGHFGHEVSTTPVKIIGDKKLPTIADKKHTPGEVLNIILQALSIKPNQMLLTILNAYKLNPSPEDVLDYQGKLLSLGFIITRPISGNRIVASLTETGRVFISQGGFPIQTKKMTTTGNETKEILHSPEIIFISHASADKVICNSFVDLLEGIGVPENCIVYTSSARHGIPGDDNIFDYLKKFISRGATIYYMLSDNYYKSTYCLNEMGAAWMVQNDFSTFLLPNLTHGIQGVIDKNKKAYDLRSGVELITLKNKLVKKYSLNLSEKKWEDIKNKFLAAIN